MQIQGNFKAELEAYEKNKERLIGEGGEGKYALIQDSTIVGVWETYEDALKSGYEKFGLDHPFLVKQISGIEQVQFITRQLN